MKKAIILFNLGGPDAPEAVQPFLFNLFRDPAIIQLPQPFRFLLAKLISGKRAKTAVGIYAQMGGKSPILDETKKQAEALEQKLGPDHKVFVSMRYWHPMAPEVVEQVKAYAPDEVILLPLYPQYSTTTTASSFSQWDDCAKKAGLVAKTRRITDYPTHPQFIAAHVELVQKAMAGMPHARVLFSAHGLPERVIAQGDPYQRQVEATVAAIVKYFPNMEHRICYQSRVGRLKWIGPSTEEELAKAGEEKKPVIVVPVAFVSEHSETLVELDIEYRELAHTLGIPHYVRVPALGVQPHFISALASLVQGK